MEINVKKAACLFIIQSSIYRAGIVEVIGPMTSAKSLAMHTSSNQFWGVRAKSFFKFVEGLVKAEKCTN